MAAAADAPADAAVDEGPACCTPSLHSLISSLWLLQRALLLPLLLQAAERCVEGGGTGQGAGGGGGGRRGGARGGGETAGGGGAVVWGRAGSTRRSRSGPGPPHTRGGRGRGFWRLARGAWGGGGGRPRGPGGLPRLEPPPPPSPPCLVACSLPLP